jgi:hypothetical protein
MRRLALEHALAQIVLAFGERGIEYLLLKGAAFARWLYDDPSERPYRDIDLLVPGDSFEAANGALGEVGFEASCTGKHMHERLQHHEIWVRRSPLPAVVELHHTLALVPAPPSKVWGRLSRGAGVIEVARAQVAVPSEAACALIVALHAAQHGARDLKHLRDLEQVLRRVEFASWEAAASLARDLDSVAAFATGLRLSRYGRPLADQLGLPTSAPRVLRLYANTPPDTAAGIERLVTTPGVRPKLRLLGQKVVPSRTYMHSRYPLARRGRWGLTLAYLLRALRLAGKLPGGVRAWLRAAVPVR